MFRGSWDIILLISSEFSLFISFVMDTDGKLMELTSDLLPFMHTEAEKLWILSM